MAAIAFNPNTEQAVALVSTAHRLLIRAKAGTGKTALLIEHARRKPEQRMLYVTFGKANQEDAAARFPANVITKTSHGLAWEVGGQFKKTGKQGDLFPSQLAKAYRIPMAFARHLRETLHNFMVSADREILPSHVPSMIGAADKPKAVQWAVLVWSDLLRLRQWSRGCGESQAQRAEFLDTTPLRMPHDGYLKLWAMTNPELHHRYDEILLDEYQDTNPVFAAVLLRQTCPVRLAGDDFQGIFGFRGAYNAFDPAQFDQVVTISESHRFGPAIAKLATMLLSEFAGEQQPVRSSRLDLATRFEVDRTQPYAIIGRTNAKLFASAVALPGTKRLHFVGGVDEYPFDKLVEVHHLRANTGAQLRDPLISAFASFAQLEAYAQDTDDKEIHSLISVAKQYGDQIPSLVSQIKAACVSKIEDADVALLTAHRSKGLEFPQVILLSDFHNMITDGGLPLVLDTPELRQELHLLYVALTRVKSAIGLNEQILAIVRYCESAGRVDTAALAASNSTVQGEGAALVVAGEPEVDFAAVAYGVGAFANVAELVGPDAALLFDGDELESRIELAILRQGLLTAAGLADALGGSVSEIADAVATMVRCGRLSAVLFLDCEAVTQRLVTNLQLDAA
ncbi:UvrD-helicase domain-containing protein [Pseudomonas fluorescens]|uniref:DNA 3'-5' helicase n=1 Tax=Pseudomonas fluorescens TaxID=294 RepID=A0A5E7QGL5_PSEFL|nr:UvrD-helicase domain-containing protein [Pseudomonas fluorescens]VVP60440.1 ATP-dependent helicase/nuclease subunit A [Pseudomonas fluorescens]